MVNLHVILTTYSYWLLIYETSVVVINEISYCITLERFCSKPKMDGTFTPTSEVFGVAELESDGQKNPNYTNL